VAAFAHGGEHTESNLTLRCRAHNALAAEKDFGRDFIEWARGSNDHESWVVVSSVMSTEPPSRIMPEVDAPFGDDEDGPPTR
jgi:hypothetical protein